MTIDDSAGTRQHTTTMEHYLKALYLLEQQHGLLATNRIAEAIGVSAPSVSNMLQRLHHMQLVSYTPYQGAVLTPAGQRAALAVLRRQRLLETFLVEMLDYTWDEVVDEANRLGHVISPKLEQRIAVRLGNPVIDPHGDPIPLPDGTLPPNEGHPLINLPPGIAGRITRVTDQRPAHLRYLADLGMVPGSEVVVHERAPFEGPLTICVNGAIHPLDSRLARAIWVVPNVTHPAT